MYFFEIYSEIGAGKYGTVKGVELLSQFCQKNYAHIPRTVIKPSDTTPSDVSPSACAKNIAQLTDFFENTLTPTLSDGLKACYHNHQMPIIISGDHSNAMGNVSAFLRQHPDKTVGVVWIDAHADLHSIYTTPSGNMHGMPLSILTNDDNQAFSINKIDDCTLQYWQRLKALSENKLAPEHLFFLGLRSFETPEIRFIKDNDIFALSATEHRQDLLGNLDILINQLKSLDAVYVSFDIDALDKTLVPATGTPVDRKSVV